MPTPSDKLPTRAGSTDDLHGMQARMQAAAELGQLRVLLHTERGAVHLQACRPLSYRSSMQLPQCSTMAGSFNLTAQKLALLESEIQTQ